MIPSSTTRSNWTSAARRRLAGIALTLFGALSLLVGIAPSPAGAADPVTPTAASLDWSVSEHVQVSSSLAPTRGAADPATLGDEGWTFPAMSAGTYDPATGATQLTFDGGLEFGNIGQGNYGVKLTDVQIHVDAAGRGRLQADVATRGPGAPLGKSAWNGATQDVTVATFDLANTSVADDGSQVSWTVTPDYPLQADEVPAETPPFDGARQFPQSFLDVAGAAAGHFADSATPDGDPNPTNVDKPPAPITVSFTYDNGSTTSSSTTSTSTTTSTTTTTIAVPDEAPDPAGSTTVTGSAGQELTVSPAENLDPNGTTVTVAGSGFDPETGIYVGYCVDNGAAAAPSPCNGGADQEGDGGGSAWISSNPPAYAVGLTTPFGPGGTFEVEIDVAAVFGDVDCLDAATSCVVSTRADHTSPQDRSADVKVPVHFVGQTPVDDATDDDPDTSDTPSVRILTTDARVGGPIVLEGSGFLPGEQVQVILHSDPVVLGVVIAAADGRVSASMVIPETTPAGTHHVELLGVTSGVSVNSAAFTISAAPAAGGGGGLARTGSESTMMLIAGVMAVAAGSILVGSSIVIRQR